MCEMYVGRTRILDSRRDDAVWETEKVEMVGEMVGEMGANMRVILYETGIYLERDKKIKNCGFWGENAARTLRSS